ncbi:helix-hairpin-helix domain-containing protein [Nannocystis pusilla]|uniref:Helix-hairpin-helix domain-containing protein n=1 Tax=Nannocystis pusilla TaxID=889268 RepID=A0A9X3ENQ6_9BACT|nr:helix-hairpin-helix domain-containing protein [Nannocystis pusilla]MCY1007463.1 helix-hairpin-helix domain-containing protein [Nannocystis pusilla]
MATPETPENEAAGERIEGAVLRVVHHNPQTRYTVLRVVRPGEVAPQTWVGRSTGIEEGMQVTAAGEWTHHPNYGKQFNFARIAAKAPTTLPGIQRRLERYPGLGAEKAERIVQRFGLDTLGILDKSPRRLLEVEGIGPKTLERILAHHTRAAARPRRSRISCSSSICRPTSPTRSASASARPRSPSCASTPTAWPARSAGSASSPPTRSPAPSASTSRATSASRPACSTPSSSRSRTATAPCRCRSSCRTPSACSSCRRPASRPRR